MIYSAYRQEEITHEEYLAEMVSSRKQKYGHFTRGYLDVPKIAKPYWREVRQARYLLRSIPFLALVRVINADPAIWTLHNPKLKNAGEEYVEREFVPSTPQKQIRDGSSVPSQAKPKSNLMRLL